MHAAIVRHNSTDNRGFDFDFLFLRRPRRTTTTRDRRKEGFKEGDIRLQDLRIRIQLHHANANTVTSLYITTTLIDYTSPQTQPSYPAIRCKHFPSEGSSEDSNLVPCTVQRCKMTTSRSVTGVNLQFGSGGSIAAKSSPSSTRGLAQSRSTSASSPALLAASSSSTREGSTTTSASDAIRYVQCPFVFVFGMQPRLISAPSFLVLTFSLFLQLFKPNAQHLRCLH